MEWMILNTHRKWYLQKHVSCHQYFIDSSFSIVEHLTDKTIINGLWFIIFWLNFDINIFPTTLENFAKEKILAIQVNHYLIYLDKTLNTKQELIITRQFTTKLLTNSWFGSIKFPFWLIFFFAKHIRLKRKLCFGKNNFPEGNVVLMHSNGISATYIRSDIFVCLYIIFEWFPIPFRFPITSKIFFLFVCLFVECYFN